MYSVKFSLVGVCSASGRWGSNQALHEVPVPSAQPWRGDAAVGLSREPGLQLSQADKAGAERRLALAGGGEDRFQAQHIIISLRASIIPGLKKQKPFFCLFVFFSSSIAGPGRPLLHSPQGLLSY